MSVILRRPWTTQPQDGARLDLSSGLLAGLQQGVLFNGRNAGTAYAITSDTSVATVNARGIAKRTSGAGGYIVAPTNATSAPWTLLVFGRLRSLSSASALMTNTELPGDSTRDRSLGITSSGAVVAYIFDGAVTTAQTSNVLAAGDFFVAAAVATGSAIRAWCNNASASTAAANTGFTGYSTPELSIGYGAGPDGLGLFGNQTSDVEFFYALKFAKALSDAELARIYANPWQLFAPLPRRIWAPAGGASPDATVAIVGARATSSAGIVVASGGASTAISGASTTSTAGVVAGSGGASTALVGASASTGAGTSTATGGATATLTGAQATSAAGTLTATAAGDAIAALVGASATSSAGVLTSTGDASTALAGAQTTATAGTLSAAGTAADATVALVGAAAAASAGTLTATGDPVAATSGGAPPWVLRELRKRLEDKRKEDEEDAPEEAQPKPEPVAKKKPAKVAIVPAPVPAPLPAPVPAVKAPLDVVPMARDWLAEWMRQSGAQLPPSSYAELMRMTAAAMAGIPRGSVSPIIDDLSLQATIQQYETARRQQDDEMLLLM